MRAVIQRVGKASVSVDDRVTGQINAGLLVLLGVGIEDTPTDAAYMADKIANLRIFSDQQGKMNLSVRDVQGDVLAVSQFTLFGDCRKGRRPGFSDAAPPERANELYAAFVRHLRDAGIRVETGVFQAHMLVSLENDGPVTMLVDSRKCF